jgi:radical SAM superfamily enzyme YgiQ (UPF0313 family)
MKLLLISLNQQDVEECKVAPTDISAFGVRYISSYLKNKGHQVNILFLAKPYGKEEEKNELVQINDLIKKLSPDLIGISLMSNHFFRARKITQFIKNEFNIPIIWGGIHATIQSEDCLNYADMVCVGEGELALEKLLSQKKENWLQNSNIPGVWYKKNKEIIRNGSGSLIENLDILPFPDYELSDHYIIHNGKLLPLNEDIYQQYYPASVGDHRLMATRGCPHACAYCCNSVFKNMYGIGFFRKRSVNNVIAEMVEIKNQFHFIKSFKIMDDTFTVNSNEWLSDFRDEYKLKINFPFFCLMSPLTINREKLDILVDCGLRVIQMGLQSGSDRTNKEVYLRYATKERFLEAIKLLDSSKEKLKLVIDVIVDNPYETEKDLLETVDTLRKIKRPFTLALFSLAFYPGTELYRRAKEDGFLNDEEEYLKKEFHLFKKNYLNKLLFLIPRIPDKLIGMFVKGKNNPFYKILVSGIFSIYSKKNKLPPIFLKALRMIKKMFINTKK